MKGLAHTLCDCVLQVLKMSSSRTVEDFNYGPDLGMIEFIANSIRNEITGELFRRVVVESKLTLALWPRLPKSDEPACQAS